MNNEQVKSIAIVGGGSSGWMTALYLNKLYNHSQSMVEIKLIESPNIPTIGVGEATVHSIRYFFAAMGLDEKELLKATNATLKEGILFKNWMKSTKENEIHQYFHSFEQQKISNYLDISSAWLLNKGFNQQRYDEAVSISSHLIKHDLSPKTVNSRPYEGVVPYGYHIDAIKMAIFMCKKGRKAGIKHIKATVNNVEVNGQNIIAVHTDKGNFSADLFIDCTGFKGLLINKVKARSSNWQSFKDALPCNKAVAVQIAYPKGQTPKAYTQATALTNGWVWEIDLVNRRGTGYVYDGDRITSAQAEQELLEHLGKDKKVLRKVHLDMHVGCMKEFWVGNCIAIGLSGGFIEPLESTGLHLINTSVRLLGTHLTSKNTSQSVKNAYNKIMNGTYDDLKQFIVLHYCLSDRDDTDFWRDVKKSARFCSGLEEKIAVWQNKVCEYMDLAGGYITMFSDENYRAILYGMNQYPTLNIPLNHEQNKLIFDDFNQRVCQVNSIVMSHADYLKNLNN
ncbi:MAG: tryptophan 7-halogenase [Pseudomonadota bacterium]